jgi:hypothetical protein
MVQPGGELFLTVTRRMSHLCQENENVLTRPAIVRLAGGGVACRKS